MRQYDGFMAKLLTIHPKKVQKLRKIPPYMNIGDFVFFLKSRIFYQHKPLYL
jgi:hypothetical protein